MRQVQLPDGHVIKVLPKPWWLFWLPSDFCITIDPYIYLPKKLYDDPVSRLDIMIHEHVHLVQQQDHPFKFYLKYVFSKSFRYEAELQAYSVQLRYLSWKLGTDLDYSGIAKDLSSWRYLWCQSYDKVMSDLKKALV